MHNIPHHHLYSQFPVRHYIGGRSPFGLRAATVGTRLTVFLNRIISTIIVMVMTMMMMMTSMVYVQSGAVVVKLLAVQQ